MLRFLIRRLIGVAAILLIVSGITFYLFFAASGADDVVRLSCGRSCTPEMREVVRQNLGLDKPLLEQYWIFLSGIFMGRKIGDLQCDSPCLGYSFANNENVFDKIVDRFPVTISLAIGAVVLFLVLGIGMGVVAALNRGKAVDKVTTGVALLSGSAPIYVLGPIFIYVFVQQLGWLDRPTDPPSFTGDPGGWATALILPWVCLMTIHMALYCRLTRSTMVDVLSEDYVRTLRAKGLSGRSVYIKHAFRGALSPIITVLGVDIGVLLSGTIITESTFSLHGLGNLAVTAVVDSDLPMMMGVVLIAATFTMLANLAVDMAYAVIDPRVRLS
ncbi:ABC transporter permease [Streptomyces sp. SID3343]|uniref:ABC transporter permease n=1 Tax=Streptomyces sp. SID3343 TaxID=2690260 RepID=UPI0013706E7E|nr:ABC transporter permease [Streptomyces sp. SID3343]MYV98218.1 ABC transporter permease subunit [Streptomyces sp. SID3343]